MASWRARRVVLEDVRISSGSSGFERAEVDVWFRSGVVAKSMGLLSFADGTLE